MTQDYKCTRCKREIKPENAKWLELSNTDGMYYDCIPDDHISQGWFLFGNDCAQTELKETSDHNEGLDIPAEMFMSRYI